MKRYIFAIVFLLTAVTIAMQAEAKPKKGFNVGPYLDANVGMIETKYDYNQADGNKVGGDYEPCFGFLFGWNAWDWLSAELQGRYSTNRNAGKREHIAMANLFSKWFLVTDAMTDFPTLRILPFLKGGMAFHIAIVPGATGSDDSRITHFGLGPSLGGGISFTWKKYFHFGADVQEDFLFFGSRHQTINGVPGVLVYKSGFHPSLGVSGFVGVHY